MARICTLSLVVPDGTPRFHGKATRHYEREADEAVFSDARKQLDAAGLALTYAADDMGSVRIDRFSDVEKAFLGSAAAIRERIEGGSSERSAAIGVGNFTPYDVEIVAGCH